MSRVFKRKIIVLDNAYIWTLKNNRIDTENIYIRIFKENHPNSVLYIAPYNHNFEIRPKSIANGIIYGLKNGWKPKINNCNLYIGMNEKGFFKLENNTFGFE